MRTSPLTDDAPGQASVRNIFSSSSTVSLAGPDVDSSPSGSSPSLMH